MITKVTGLNSILLCTSSKYLTNPPIPDGMFILSSAINNSVKTNYINLSVMVILWQKIGFQEVKLYLAQQG